MTRPEHVTRGIVRGTIAHALDTDPTIRRKVREAAIDAIDARRVVRMIQMAPTAEKELLRAALSVMTPLDVDDRLATIESRLAALEGEEREEVEIPDDEVDFDVPHPARDMEVVPGVDVDDPDFEVKGPGSAIGVRPDPRRPLLAAMLALDLDLVDIDPAPTNRGRILAVKLGNGSQITIGRPGLDGRISVNHVYDDPFWSSSSMGLPADLTVDDAREALEELLGSDD